MATDQRFDPYGDQPESGKRPSNWLTNCLIGCLIIAVVVLVIGGAIAYWVSQNWRGWVSTAGAQVVTQTVNQSDLPQQEKDDINTQVQRVTDAFSNGDISLEQVGRIIEKLTQSPILPAIIVYTADAKYLDNSGLSDDDKTEGRVSLQRFVRGAVDGSIDQASVDSALEHVADRQQDGSWQLRDQVTDEQLRAFLAAAKAEADKAGIPEDPPPFDPSDEIKRIIDEAMAGPVVAP